MTANKQTEDKIPTTEAQQEAVQASDAAPQSAAPPRRQR